MARKSNVVCRKTVANMSVQNEEPMSDSDEPHVTWEQGDFYNISTTFVTFALFYMNVKIFKEKFSLHNKVT